MNWQVTPKEAIEIQKKLREQVKIIPLKHLPTLIGGCDVSMNLFATHGFAGFVMLSYPELRLLSHSVVKEKIQFPYLPGLLSFREIPMLKKAWKKLKQKPELIMVDGVGIAHPRGLGIAAHLGLELGVPTIGCAKNVLYGRYTEPSNKHGSYTYLFDPKTGKKIGATIRTKPYVKPVFVSPGHLITLEESVAIVKNCIIRHRLPEPTRLAHKVVNEYRQA